MFGNLVDAVKDLTRALREAGGNDKQTQAILKRMDEMETHIMAAIDDIRKELGVINGVTNEIAADIDELITKIGTGMTDAEAQEVVAGLKEVSATLTGVAAKYPVVTPTP